MAAKDGSGVSCLVVALVVGATVAAIMAKVFNPPYPGGGGRDPHPPHPGVGVLLDRPPPPASFGGDSCGRKGTGGGVYNGRIGTCGEYQGSIVVAVVV